MNNPLTWVVLTLALGGAAIVILNQGTFEAMNHSTVPETIIEEVTPDWATDEDAVKAAQDVIRKKELEAQENALEAEIAALEAQLEEVQKELGSY